MSPGNSSSPVSLLTCILRIINGKKDAEPFLFFLEGGVYNLGL